MEDQGKRLLLAVVIAFGIMMLWSMLFPPERSEKKEQPEVAAGEQVTGDAGAGAPTAKKPGEQIAGSAVGATPTEPAPTPGEPSAERPQSEVTPPTARPEESLHTFEFDSVKAVFSTHSGALKSWELKGKKFRDRATGGKRQTDLTPTGNTEMFPSDDADLYSFAIGFAKSSDHQIPPKTVWTVDRKTETEIDFSWQSSDLRVVKKYKFLPEDYLLELTVEAQKISAGEAKQSLVVTTFGYQDPNASTGGRWTRVETAWKTACYVSGDLKTNSAKYLARGPQRYPGRVQWAGFTHSYFLAAYAPRADVEGEFECVATAVKDSRPGTMRLDLIFGPPAKLRGGKVISRTITAYLGPKYLDKLDSISGVVGYPTGFEKSVDLGWFAFIARPLLWLLAWFQSFVINWGIAIILLTIVVKLATLYWTTKSMRSMKAMAELKPEVEKIQKKHKDDKQRQQVEIMAMYKAHKVSPLSGCLPMLLQMPIWFALYKTLMVAAELYQAPFIPGWIDDLTSPDPFYVLPVALTGMMFLQSKLSPSVADSMQQKIMMYGLPLMFGVFSLFFPAGLTLYIFTNTCLTAVHHLWMNRTDKKKKAAAARPASARIAEAEANSGTRKQDEQPAEEERSETAPAADKGEPKGSRAPTKSGPRKSKGSRPRKRAGHRKKGSKRKRSAGA